VTKINQILTIRALLIKTSVVYLLIKSLQYDCYVNNYLRWRPHFALPFAASLMVIPLEQDIKIVAAKITVAGSINFFIGIVLVVKVR